MMGEKRGAKEEAAGRESKRRVGAPKVLWTPEEDAKLTKLVQVKGECCWSEIADMLPGRAGKQCRDRWRNHLNPRIKKSEWTAEEDRLLFYYQTKFGHSWSNIAKQLPGRTDLSVKNRWYSFKRKSERQKDRTSWNEYTPHGCKSEPAASIATTANMQPPAPNVETQTALDAISLLQTELVKANQRNEQLQTILGLVLKTMVLNNNSNRNVPDSLTCQALELNQCQTSGVAFSPADLLLRLASSSASATATQVKPTTTTINQQRPLAPISAKLPSFAFDSIGMSPTGSFKKSTASTFASIKPDCESQKKDPSETLRKGLQL